MRRMAAAGGRAAAWQDALAQVSGSDAGPVHDALGVPRQRIDR